MAACRNTESRQATVSAHPACCECTVSGTLPTERIAGTTGPVLLGLLHDAILHDPLRDDATSPVSALFDAIREAKRMRICCH